MSDSDSTNTGTPRGEDAETLDSLEGGGTRGGRGLEPGTVIDRYKLLQRIGEGGFGTVWMAEQREPVRRRVALKVVKLGMDTKQVIARFEAERQALAMMDHPNIARVFDAGSTESGRPFFAMEYIRGIPVLEYCDTERLDTDARLDLFVPICHAIQHAHQKGIIHRDIKPSNVLVTLHDGRPVPKVIDFGIAKATNAELTQKTLFTEHRQMIGTPVYMSPEQAEMSGLDIDTRSDIYSLGVLLYELMTGTTPFVESELLSKGFAEMLRFIREQEPQKPSTKLNTLGESAETTAAMRRSDSKRLASTLKGDLDWIVMKCLEKDRTRRYETANALAADIERHRADEPVEAGPPTAGYRLRKFAKRHRGRVIAASVLAAVLVLGGVGTIAGLVWALSEKERADGAAAIAAVAQGEAEENAQRASEAASRAELELERATQIKEFVIRMITGLRPEVVRDTDTRLFETMLSSARADLEAGGIDDLEVRGELYHTMGEAHRMIGRPIVAAGLFESAYEDRRAALGENHEQSLSSMIAKGVVLADANYLSESLEVLQSALIRAREHLGERSPVTLWASHLNAWVLGTAGLYEGALEYAEFAYYGAKETLGKDDLATTSFGGTYAYILRRLGRTSGVAELEAASLRGAERAYSEGDPRLLIERFDAVRRARADGARVDVIERGMEVTRNMRRHLGEKTQLATTYEQELGAWMIEDGRIEEAVEFLSGVVERMSPSRHWIREHRLALSFLEWAAQLSGREALAEATRRDALRVPSYPFFIYDEIDTSGAYAATGFMGEVSPMYIREFLLDPDHPERGAVFQFSLSAGQPWGGLVWQDPANNWGQWPGGFDLRGADRLVFDARGKRDGTVVKVGLGLQQAENPYSDSGRIEKAFTLSTSWESYEIDLEGVDLSRIFSGLVVVLEGGEEEVVVELDRVRYEQD